MSGSLEMQRLLNYPGVNAQKFPLFLQELQFRYEHCDQDLDDRIQVLTGYIVAWRILSNHQSLSCHAAD